MAFFENFFDSFVVKKSVPCCSQQIFHFCCSKPIFVTLFNCLNFTHYTRHIGQLDAKWDSNETVHYVVMNFKQAYNSSGSGVLNILIEFGIIIVPPLLLKLYDTLGQNCR
jgi:hypothetical protein